MKKVGIIMGSASDMPIVKKGIDMLDSLGIPYEVHVYSAHRTPVEAAEFTKNAKTNGFGVMIAAAGMAAHLAGAVAANTTLPVIGIPCKSSNLDGLDALLSTVQMPTGIPVAIVVDTGENVFGKTMPIMEIIILIALAALAIYAVYLIVRAVKNRKKGGDRDDGNDNGNDNSRDNNSGWGNDRRKDSGWSGNPRY